MSDKDQEKALNRAWHYSEGNWTLGANPVLDAYLDSDKRDSVSVKMIRKLAGRTTPVEAVIRSLGYMEILRVGVRFQAGFDLWEHEDGSALIVTGEDEDTRFFYVSAAPDARDICARWAALTRDKVIIDIVDDLTGISTDLNITGDAITRIQALLGNSGRPPDDR